MFFAPFCEGGHGHGDADAPCARADFGSNAYCYGPSYLSSHSRHPVPGTWKNSVRGEAALLEGPLPETKTYARIFIPHPLIDIWRRELLTKEDTLGGGNGYTVGGCQYANESSRESGEYKSTAKEDKGSFLIKQTFREKEDIPQESDEYLLRQLQVPLERTMDKSFPEILDLLRGYGISYLLYYYFDPVEMPDDGNIVIYTNTFGVITHMGIFRTPLPKGTSSDGETVESYWPSRMARAPNPHVFQHDPFFLPALLGTKAFFYSLRPSPRKGVIPSALSLLSQPLDPELVDRVWGHHAFPIWHEPAKIWTLPHYYGVHMKRKQNIDVYEGKDLEQKISSIKYLTHLRTFGVCYHHAMCLLCNISLLPMYLEDRPYSTPVFLDRFTNVVRIPQRGDLVTYFSPQRQDYLLHYGIYVGNGIVESKWGAGGVYQHPIFFVPHIYGDGVQFRRLKNGYTSVSLRLFLQKTYEGEKRSCEMEVQN